MNYNWEPGGTGLWIWIWTWLGNPSKALVAFVSPVVDWGPSIALDTSQVIYLLSWAHTCLWERKGSLLSCRGFRLFPNRLLEVGNRWRSKHHTETGPAVLGAWSPNLDGDIDSSTGVEWVSLVYAWGTSKTCVFGVPSWATLIRESPFLRDGTTWLLYSTVVRTERWKMKKWFWLLNPYLKQNMCLPRIVG
jgi:hypothetical protein